MRSLLVTGALVFLGCRGSEVPAKDLLRDARIGCQRGDALSCFHAGAISAEEQGGASRAAGFFAQGCAQKHGASCDGLAAIKGPEREPALVQGCNAGDMLSCVRLADDYPKDAKGLERAKALREQVCRQAIVLKAGTAARDVHGAAEGCAKLAAMHATGVGANADPVRALKLEALSMMLKTEALARYIAEDDASVEAILATKKSSALEKDRLDRLGEAEEKAREALIASAGPKEKSGDGGSLPITHIEQLFFGGVTLPAAPQPSGDDASTCKDTGDPLTCAIAGAQAEKNDPQAPLELHVAGCNKAPEHCWSLVVFAELLLKRRDAPRGQWLLERGCEAKAPMACMRLGAELAEGERGIALDMTKAARTLDKACQYGSARGCLMFAALVEDGRGAGRDPGRAKQLRAKADGLDRPVRTASSPATAAADEETCRKTHDAIKCIAAGMSTQDFDAGKAEELFRIGCAASKNNCGLWSFAIERFRKDDGSRGMRILEQGCAEGSSLACHALAEVVHLGWRATPRNETRATEAYGKACELGDSIACRAAAARTRAAKDAAKADELKERGLKADEESVKGDSGDKWARDASSQRARGPHAADLDKARVEFLAIAEKAHARAQLREQRVNAKNAGKRLKPLPPPSKEEADASTARVDAIRRSAAALVSPPAK
jgi:TPR repeat protein